MSDSGAADGSGQQRFDEIVEDQAAHSGVTVGKMFGAQALKLGGKVFALRTDDDRLVVKIPAHRVTALVEAGDGERFDPGHGRPMREWFDTPARLTDGDEARWRALVDEARMFVGSLSGS